MIILDFLNYILNQALNASHIPTVKGICIQSFYLIIVLLILWSIFLLELVIIYYLSEWYIIIINKFRKINIIRNKCSCGNKIFWSYNSNMLRCSACVRDYNKFLFFFYKEQDFYKSKVKNYKEIMK